MTGPAGRVLVVDDDPGAVETFARILRLEGHDVRTASNAESGLESADLNAPDAILVDLRMPLINGVGFLYRLRERPQYRDTPVAVVTGDYFLDDEVSREIMGLGAQIRFKPLDMDDLITLTQSLLSQPAPGGAFRASTH